MAERLLELRNVSLGYGKRIVLQDVNLCIPAGDFFGLVGPNGAGKTTLLRGLLGTLRPRAGIILRGQPSQTAGLVFGYVPQEKQVDPMFPLSVLEVVLMGRYKKLGPGRRPGVADRSVAIDSLRHVGLDSLAQASFQELSGGQKQRVLIARALAAEPHVIVLDEPTSGMDVAAEKHLMQLIKRLHETERLTIIVATHNLNMVAQYTHHLAMVTPAGLLVGDTATLLTTQELRRVYQIDVTVQEIDGKRFIL
jgi:ABC-type Mn2+/Zn2+ transport system ATPase subunit